MQLIELTIIAFYIFLIAVMVINIMLALVNSDDGICSFNRFF